MMSDLHQLASTVLTATTMHESHWLEWKSAVDLNERGWQGQSRPLHPWAANRPRSLAATAHDGCAFMLLGVEPGRASGTNMVDPAIVDAGLVRFLGRAGPRYVLDYVSLAGVAIAVITVQPTLPGLRPYLSRGSFSDNKPVLRDGGIFIRRGGATVEASSAEIDNMLGERGPSSHSCRTCPATWSSTRRRGGASAVRWSG
jgi:hypothetical protein